MGDHWTSQGLQILSLTPRKRKKILWQKHGKLEDEKYLKEKNTKKYIYLYQETLQKLWIKTQWKIREWVGQTHRQTVRLLD